MQKAREKTPKCYFCPLANIQTIAQSSAPSLEIFKTRLDKVLCGLL